MDVPVCTYILAGCPVQIIGADGKVECKVWVAARPTYAEPRVSHAAKRGEAQPVVGGREMKPGSLGGNSGAYSCAGVMRHADDGKGCLNRRPRYD